MNIFNDNIYFDKAFFDKHFTLEKLEESAKDKDKCVHCGDSTAFGSGKFVNRIGHGDGWACAECMSEDCERCGATICLDEDVTPDDCGLPEFLDGADRVCESCLSKFEKRQLAINYLPGITK